MESELYLQHFVLTLMCVHYSYKPLTETIKKFKITHNVLPQAAWNFVNDGYANSTLALFINTSTQFMSVLHAKKVVHST
jgi:hypothetical protein